MTALLDDQLAALERTYIEVYLLSKGYNLRDLSRLPGDLAHRLRVEASMYASTKLVELETRSNLIRHIHGEY
jgi:hypothetical protein